MPIIEKYIDVANKVRISWKDSEENIFNFKFDSEISDEEVEELGQKMCDHAKLSAVQPVGDYKNIKDFIIPVIELIKSSHVVAYDDLCNLQPSAIISYDEFSNWVSALNWNIALIVRNFIFDFINKYVQQYNIVIPNQSESAYFELFCSIIVECSDQKLARLLFDEYQLY